MPRRVQTPASDDSLKENSALTGKAKVKMEKVRKDAGTAGSGKGKERQRDEGEEEEDGEEDELRSEPEDQEDGEDGEGSPKGRKRARVNGDGDSRPSRAVPNVGRTTALPRDKDGQVHNLSRFFFLLTMIVNFPWWWQGSSQARLSVSSWRTSSLMTGSNSVLALT
jgi:hypothetical protein